MAHSLPEETWCSQLELVGSMLAYTHGGTSTHLSHPSPPTHTTFPTNLLQFLTLLQLAPRPSLSPSLEAHTGGS